MSLLGPVVAREIRTDRLPALSLIRRLEQDVGRRIKRCGIDRRDDDGRRPLEPVLHVGRRAATGRLRPDRDIAGFAEPMIVSRHDAVIRAGVDDVRVARIGSDVAAFAAADLIPVGVIDAAAAGPARNRNGGVVLLRAVDPVRKLIVGDHVIKLTGRLVLERRPGPAAIPRDCRAAVVAVDHALRIVRRDPEAVVVGVGRTHHLKRAASIGRFVDLQRRHIHRFRVLRVGDDVTVVPGALADARVPVHPLPGRTCIL